jgi:hypothetical protein
MRRSLRRKGETRDTRRDSGVVERLAAAVRKCSPSVKAHITRLVVEVGDRSDAWRDAAVEAELAFVRWKRAAQGARAAAAAAYMVAIDCEEQAANEYRRAWEACCTAVPGAGVPATWLAPGRKSLRWHLTYDIS